VIGLGVGLAVSRDHGQAALDPDLVVVAPFTVLDPGLAVWREGMVDVLSRTLDGAGPLRTVAPSVVVQRSQGRGDRASAEALAHATRAGLVVYGSLVTSGRDSARALVTLLMPRPAVGSPKRIAANRSSDLTISPTPSR
jgi:hypothetical protein